jgi:hypothetical protein
MKRVSKTVFWVALLFQLSAWAETQSESLDHLFQKYRNMSSFAVHMDQTTHSPHLIKPTRQKVLVELKNGNIDWTVDQKRLLQLKVSNSGHLVPLDNPSGPLGPFAKSEVFLSTLRALKSLLFFEPSLREEFSIEIKGRQLSLVPKKKIPIQRIHAQFDLDWNLKSLRFDGADDMMTFEVRSLVWNSTP